MDKVVTRFAPSPTGFMHVGGVRTALYAWMFAKKYGGTFILRIEDTDKAREVTGSIEHIQDSLRWLGITWDQGPYLQSERLDIYKKYAQQLIEKGLAYPDPYSEQELEAFRKEAEMQKKPFLYRDYRPETFGVWDGTKALRYKTPLIKRYEWHDEARGELSAGEEALDDFILIKSDGYPTYNFAHIIDDLEMGVTHIMRGEEFISSMPKFLSLYDGLEITSPKFATMPVILNQDGNKKLSKRDGAKDILDYKAEGYIPEALVNFLALLGWHPEGDKEVLTIHELTNAFDITRIQKGGAKFDEVKLKWFNHEHLKMLPLQDYINRLGVFLKDRGLAVPPYLQEIGPELRNRAQTLLEASGHLTNGEFAFMEVSIAYPSELLLQGAKSDTETIKKNLQDLSEILKESEPFTQTNLQEKVMPFATEKGRASVLWPMRVALSGKEKSPDPFTLAALLGKTETLARIAAAVKIL